jgi:hypothetical protein
MLRHNLAGLIEPMLSSAGTHTLGGHPKRDKLGDTPGQPSWRSSLLSDPSAKFFGGEPGDRQKNKWPGFKVTTQAHDSRAVRTAQHKSHRTIDPQCLENPRPEGAESTLTGNAASPFHAEPRHLGSNRTEGSSPSSHHLGLLSEEKFWGWGRLKIYWLDASEVVQLKERQ